jgi:uncharacterized membrane protein
LSEKLSKDEKQAVADVAKKGDAVRKHDDPPTSKAVEAAEKKPSTDTRDTPKGKTSAPLPDGSDPANFDFFTVRVPRQSSFKMRLSEGDKGSVIATYGKHRAAVRVRKNLNADEKKIVKALLGDEAKRHDSYEKLLEAVAESERRS